MERGRKQMSWYCIVIIALFVYWTIGLILAVLKEEWSQYWSMGLVYPIAFVILYPIRAWMIYSEHKEWYEKRGISRLQYMLGKRVHKKNIKMNKWF